MTGDLVLNRFNAYRGALGAAPEGGLVSPDYLVLRPGRSSDPGYLEYLLRSDLVGSHMRQSMSGLGAADPDASGFSRIDARALNLLKVAIPDLSEQVRLADFLRREIDHIDQLIRRQERLVATLRERRAAVVEAAVSHPKHYALELDNDRALPDYVALVLGTRAWRDLIELEATGASPSMQNISQGDILNLPMPLPSVEQQRRVLARVDEHAKKVRTLIAKAEQFIALARERRSALITAAVTGQIDVRSAS